MKRKVLTVREVSEYLRVHPSTVYRLLRKNQLPAFRVGSDWRFSADSIAKWLAEIESAGQAPAEVQNARSGK
jgi:excisionase family DNA binding protein